jgi:hypothetical protein
MSADFNITSPIDAYLGIFILPLLSSSNTSESLVSAVSSVVNAAVQPYPLKFFVTFQPVVYNSFYDYYVINNGPLDAGGDYSLGGRLLDEKALTSNITALRETLKAITPGGSASSLYLVGGHGVRNAVPRGGSNAVNSAWRKALVHCGKASVRSLLL